MNFSKGLTAVLSTAAALNIGTGCSSGSSNPANLINPSIPTTQANTATPYLAATGPNVMTVVVGGTSVCGTDGAVNEACTSVTICVPGTTQCQTISDVLVDTGSTGLRLFSSVVNLPLTQQTVAGGQELAECGSFGTGSDWGPVVSASVQLGGEPGVVTPIQLINAGYASLPTPCAQSDVSPVTAGYNGILGVGLFDQDCGPYCASDPTSQFYFSCPATGTGACSPITLPLVQQLQNPVSLLPVDNNGTLLAMPTVPATGSATASGLLILGVGTQANNAPQGLTPFVTDPNGNIGVLLNGSSIPGSFVDSGSNGYYFPNDVALALCPADGPVAGFYCTESLSNFVATAVAADGTSQANVPFQIAPADGLLNSGNAAFNNLGGPATPGFDFGLPFFYGRAIVTQIENAKSSLGTGPLFAY